MIPASAARPVAGAASPEIVTTLSAATFPHYFYSFFLCAFSP
jgi:hypothetical protein